MLKKSNIFYFFVKKSRFISALLESNIGIYLKRKLMRKIMKIVLSLTIIFLAVMIHVDETYASSQSEKMV